jgi:hypothetical protein
LLDDSSSGLGAADVTTTFAGTAALTIDSADDTNGDGIVVYEDDGNAAITIGDSSDVTTITISGTPDDIFVLRFPNDVTFGTGTNPSGDPGPGVRMLLKGGVNPNNIFWVFGGNVTFNDASSGTAPDDDWHQLTGNFIGSGTFTIGDYTRLLGVRLLGFTSLLPSILPSNFEVTAMTTQAQPLLVPVLQIHQPKGDAKNNTTGIPSGSVDAAAKDTRWIQRVEKDTEINGVFLAGDVPSDPVKYETNGGVQNIVRFMENWQQPTQRKSKIQGSFMQSGRSKFATAPLQQAEGKPTSGNPSPSNLFKYPMMYYTGTGDRKHGIFAPPNRVWGYDVGLLSQPMDRFDFELSEPVDEPDEYFREVSRNDAWVKALLCAVDEDDNPVASDVYNSNFCADYQ